MDFLFILLLSVSISYGWAMRGTLIGHSAGAMLPGALLGLVLSLNSGNAFMAENFWIFAAAGAIGTYFGGDMTYGETLNFSHGSNPPERYGWSILGVFLKGGIWIAIAGSILGISISASSKYSIIEIAAIAAGIIIFRFIGEQLLNRPYDPSKNIFPKIYFSKTRKESWGGLLAALLYITVFVLIKRDMFAFNLILIGFASGSIGFAIGQMLQVFMLHSGALGKTRKTGLVDSWKIMEFVFGAIIGIGFAFGFLRHGKSIVVYKGENIEATTALTASFIWIALIIALEVYKYIIQKRKAHSNKIIVKFFSDALYAYIPLVFIISGNLVWSKLVAGPIIIWVLIRQLFNDQLKNISKPYKIISMVILFFTIVYSYMADYNYLFLWMTYITLYIAATFVVFFLTDKIRKSNYSVFLYYIIQMIFLLILGPKIL